MLGICSGGTLQSMALAALQQRGELADKVAGFALAVCVLDQAQAGTAAAFLDDTTAAAATAASARRGYLDGRALAEVFAWLRPNDLIWNYWVNNYLEGKDPPPFDILFWNADTTRMTAALHRDLLDLALRNALVRPGAASMLGAPVDLSSITTDGYVIAGVADHISPWQACYRSAQLFGGNVRFVLSTSGHIAAMVNPPTNPKATHQAGSADLGAEPADWHHATPTTPARGGPTTWPGCPSAADPNATRRGRRAAPGCGRWTPRPGATSSTDDRRRLSGRAPGARRRAAAAHPHQARRPAPHAAAARQRDRRGPRVLRPARRRARPRAPGDPLRPPAPAVPRSRPGPTGCPVWPGRWSRCSTSSATSASTSWASRGAAGSRSSSRGPPGAGAGGSCWSRPGPARSWCRPPHVLARMATPRRYVDPDYLRRVAPHIYGGTARDDPTTAARVLHPHRRAGSHRGYALHCWRARGGPASRSCRGCGSRPSSSPATTTRSSRRSTGGCSPRSSPGPAARLPRGPPRTHRPARPPGPRDRGIPGRHDRPHRHVRKEDKWSRRPAGGHRRSPVHRLLPAP